MEKLGFFTPDLSEDNLINCHNFDFLPCVPADAYISPAYLSRMAGPISEARDPYGGAGTGGECPEGLNPNACVFDSRFLPNDPLVIKQAILDYGALFTGFYWDDYYYNQSNYTYYYSGSYEEGGFHAVTLSGWDDTKITDGGTGAWIVKNSWNNPWTNGFPSDEGYFYISYNDPDINSQVAYFPSRISNDLNSKLYYYDDFGACRKIGYNNSEAYGLIKFISTRDEQLTKIMVWTNTYNTILDIDVYDDFDGSSLSGLIAQVLNFNCDFPGYHTIDIVDPVLRNKDDDFYIRVKYSSPGVLCPISVEEYNPNRTSNAIIESGVCWTSSNGNSWDPIGSDTDYPFDLCIKAYTNKSEYIAQLEYFIDSDPGFGHGISLDITSSNNLQTLFNLPLENVADGIHAFFIRSKNEDGKWSHTEYQPFYKFTFRPEINVVSMEYFFDSDPGFGNGQPVEFLSGPNVEKLLNIPLTNLNTGIHTLYFRAKDNYENWSMVQTQTFYRFEAGNVPDITAFEYFIDSDPGFGNAYNVDLTASVYPEIFFNIDLIGIEPGIHKLYTRVRNAEKKWSHCGTNTFYHAGNLILKNIVSLEYYFDTDPGFGNGFPVSLTPEPQIDEIFQIDLESVNSGQHIFYLRAKDNLGKWSLISYQEVQKLQLKIFLEGPFDNQTEMMENQLFTSGLIPLYQPFNSNQNAVWYYDGNEYIETLLNDDIVDWVLLK
ncbi:MAG: lectin like domain-containing protein [Bacteroidales bacterium]